MTDLAKLRGDWPHAETLACGRTIAPGEPFERSLLEDGDGRLLEEGLIIDAIVAPVPLEGDELRDRAKALNITGRAKLSADELREAVAAAELAQQTNAGQIDQPQRVGER